MSCVGRCFGLDVGGSLAKFCVLEGGDVRMDAILNFLKSSEKYGTSGNRDKYLELELKSGTLHFVRFDTSQMAAALTLIKEEKIHVNVKQLLCCGGGALLFADLFLQKLEIQLKPIDEFEALIEGLCFLIRRSKEEVFRFEFLEEKISSKNFLEIKKGQIHYPEEEREENFFPLLICNVGSGVSCIFVENEKKFSRVGGTALGGASFLGLSKTLCGVDSFDEAMELAEKGSRFEVDLSVQDIYGGHYVRGKLPPTATAAFFAKAKKDTKKEDLACSLLNMVAQNCAQVSFLYAQQCRVNHVLFTGSFFRRNEFAAQRAAYNLARWSSMSHLRVEALFLRHEGYLGATGSFVRSQLDI